MSSGAFDNLLPLSENLARKGNEAEVLRRSPEYCLTALRGWLEYLLQFLERQHSIPTALKEDYIGQGENEYRINRLLAHGVQISNTELELLHDIRKDSNKAVHPADNEHFFTSANAEKNLRNAALIRDWLCLLYVPHTDSNNGASLTDTVQQPASHIYETESFSTPHQHVTPERRAAVDDKGMTGKPQLNAGLESTIVSPPRDFAFPRRKSYSIRLRRTFILGLSSLLVFFGIVFIGKHQRSSMPGAQMPGAPIPPVTAMIKAATAPLASVGYDGKNPVTLRYMNLTVTVDSQPNPNGVGQVAVARGQYEDRIAFSLRADRTIRSGVSSALVELRQLNLSTGVPQVVFTYFSGGAHCCMQTMIVTRDPSGKWHSVDGGALDGDGGYEFINLDSTGGNLLVSLDNSFLYAFACYACSFAPTSIKRLVGAELLDVTRNPKYLTFLRERLQQMEARARSAGNTLHSNGFLGGWVAAKALVGELEDAWRTMLFSYDHNSGWLMEECLAAFPLQQCPAGKKRRIDFPEALAKHLFKNGYVTAEQKEQLIAWANRGQPAPPASSVAASKVAVVTALQNQMRPGEQRTFYNTVIAGSYALQSWGNANEGGEALLKYDPSSNHWNLVTWGGGAWDAVGLIQEGVPPDAAAALVAGVPGREAWIARERACAAEWKADKAAGKISDGMKWPQYYSDCYKRKKAEGL